MTGTALEAEAIYLGEVPPSFQDYTRIIRQLHREAIDNTGDVDSLDSAEVLRLFVRKFGPKPTERAAFRTKETSRVDSVNGQLKIKSLSSSLEKLGAPDLSIEVISVLSKAPVVVNKDKYFGIYLAILPSGADTDRFCYIRDGKQPAADKMCFHLCKLLKREFAWDYVLFSGRYMFNFENAPGSLVNDLLALAKEGDGKLIDYSWIAPLQELKLLNQVTFDKPIKQKKGKANPWAAISVDTYEPPNRKARRVTQDPLAAVQAKMANDIRALYGGLAPEF
jgi:hypothetical protein